MLADKYPYFRKDIEDARRKGYDDEDIEKYITDTVVIPHIQKGYSPEDINKLLQTDRYAEPKEEPSWVDVGISGIKQAGGRAVAGIAGAAEALTTPVPAPPEVEETLSHKIITAPSRVISEGFGIIAQAGEEYAEAATLKTDNPYKREAANVMAAATQVGGAFAASLATKNPIPMITAMAGMAGGNQYRKMKAGGASEREAFLGGIAVGGATRLTFGIPFGRLFSSTGIGLKSGLVRLADYMGTSLAGEELEEAIAIAIDKGTINKDMTFLEGVERLKQVGITTGLTLGITAPFMVRMTGRPAKPAKTAEEVKANIGHQQEMDAVDATLTPAQLRTKQMADLEYLKQELAGASEMERGLLEAEIAMLQVKLAKAAAEAVVEPAAKPAVKLSKEDQQLKDIQDNYEAVARKMTENKDAEMRDIARDIEQGRPGKTSPETRGYRLIEQKKDFTLPETPEPPAPEVSLPRIDINPMTNVLAGIRQKKILAAMEEAGGPVKLPPERKVWSGKRAPRGGFPESYTREDIIEAKKNIANDQKLVARKQAATTRLRKGAVEFPIESIPPDLSPVITRIMEGGGIRRHPGNVWMDEIFANNIPAHLQIQQKGRPGKFLYDWANDLDMTPQELIGVIKSEHKNRQTWIDSVFTNLMAQRRANLLGEKWSSIEMGEEALGKRQQPEGWKSKADEFHEQRLQQQRDEFYENKLQRRRAGKMRSKLGGFLEDERGFFSPTEAMDGAVKALESLKAHWDKKKLTFKAKKLFAPTRGMTDPVYETTVDRVALYQEGIWGAKQAVMAIEPYMAEYNDMTLRSRITDALMSKAAARFLPDELRAEVEWMRKDLITSQLELRKYVDDEGLRDIIDRSVGRYLKTQYQIHNVEGWNPSREVRDAFATEKRLEWAAKRDEMQQMVKDKPGLSKTLDKHIKLYDDLAMMSKADMEIRLDTILDNQRQKSHYITGNKPTIDQHSFRALKDLTPATKAFYGEIDNPIWRYHKTKTTLSQMVAAAKMLDGIVKIGEQDPSAAIFRTKEQGPTTNITIQIPDSAIWGNMRGGYLNKEMFEILNGELNNNPRGLAGLAFMENWVSGPFRTVHTAGSEQTHAKQLFGNPIFSFLDGNSLHNPANWKYFVEAFKTIWNRSSLQYRDTYKKCIRHGWTDTEFYNREGMRRVEDFALNPGRKNLDTVERLGDLWDKTMTQPWNKIKFAFNSEDAIFKIAAGLKKVDKGKSWEQAGKEIRAHYPDYRDVPEFIHILRQTQLFGPFPGFKYNVARIAKNHVVETVGKYRSGDKVGALEGLARIAVAGTTGEILREALMNWYNVDRKEIAKFEALRPARYRNGTTMYIRNSRGELIEGEYGYGYPFGDVTKLVKALRHGDLEGAVEATQFMQSPLLETASIVATGYDPYWDKEYGNEYDTLWEKVKTRSAAAIKVNYLPPSSPVPSVTGLLHGDVTPGLLTGYQVESLYEAYYQLEDKNGRKKWLTGEVLAWLPLPAMKFRKSYVEESLDQALKTLKYHKTRLKSTRTQWLKNNTGKRPWEIEQEMRKFEKQEIAIDNQIDKVKDVNPVLLNYPGRKR